MTQSEQLFEKSEHFLPGGVNSPVRAFRNVGGTPVFVKSGKGSHILDEDGNDYIVRMVREFWDMHIRL